MKRIQEGLIAGLFAGLVLAILYFVDYGPGNALRTLARLFGLDSAGAGTYIGFILCMLLGGVSGLLFGALQRSEQPSLGRSLLLGTGVGLLFWVIVRLLIGTLIIRVPLDFSSFLFSIVTFLLYGFIMGGFFFQRHAMKSNRERLDMATAS